MLRVMKPLVYIEISVVSYLTSRPSRDLVTAAHQELTRQWWLERSPHFELVISELVEQEIARGDATASSERGAQSGEAPFALVRPEEDTGRAPLSLRRKGALGFVEDCVPETSGKVVEQHQISTAVGVYTLWILLNEGTEQLFATPLRRAFLLRPLLVRKAPQTIRAGRLSIDDGVLGAFLRTERFIHGARSVEAIIDQSSLAGKARYGRSSLPPADQLSLHVDAEAFLGLLREEHCRRPLPIRGSPPSYSAPSLTTE